MQMPSFAALFLVPLLSAPTVAQGEPEGETTLWGHSNHGAAYDEGPRQQPWKMEGIGDISFPITSSNPEVQEWFNQAIALLHGFWGYEAERSLRWCLKLDPECAMAYWGMSLAAQGGDRASEFLDEAVARMDSVTERERAFIEVSVAFRAIDEAEESEEDEAKREAIERFDRLLMDYPDDVEAKALYWLQAGKAIGRKAFRLSRYGMESVLDDILELDPDHVGALHYRVHNWDGKDGHYAIDTCRKLGKVAPNCGHLLHMPGHVLSGIGHWHDAAIAMDRATRVEKAYMNERMILPEDNWDYVHNLDYLCYIQEQLGMVDQALLGAEQLLAAPAFSEMPFFNTMVRGPTIRALVKFQRWEEILEPDRIPWDMENPMDQALSAQLRTRALIGLGRIEEAEEELASIGKKPSRKGPGRRAAPSSGGAKKPSGPGGGEGGPQAKAGDAEDDDDPSAFMAQFQQRQAEAAKKQLEAMLQLAKGEHLDGLTALAAAAEEQEERWSNDPPRDGEYLYNFLGDTYLELGAPKLAVECYERTLETIFHDGFALAGLVVAHTELRQEDQAREAMAKLQVVWSDADRPNRWLEAAEATGITAEPRLDDRDTQRNYKRDVLDVEGPSLWLRSEVPELTALDATGDEVALSDYLGQNVILIFYLGEQCVHCIEQLTLAEERLASIEERDTVVLAVSRDSVEEIAGQQEDFGITLLSDVDFENARRFRSFDDFEEIELHSTFILDREGKLHWSRIGGEPFTDFDYIEGELDRLNRLFGVPVAEAQTPADETPLEGAEAGAPAGGPSSRSSGRQ